MLSFLTLLSAFALSPVLSPMEATGSQVGPADPLDNTAWELFAYRRTRPPEWLQFRVEFSNGKLAGFGGCNEFAGSYQVSDPRFEIVEVDWVNRQECSEPEGVMEQEAFLFLFLQAGRRIQIEEGDEKRLLIFRPDGEALTFKPAG